MRHYLYMQKILFLLLLFLSQWSWTQSFWNGKVTDPNGEPLAFVNILLNGDPHDGITTDIDGRFSLNSDDDIDYLLFSYLGYEQLEFSLRDKNTNEPLTITLRPTSFELNEAVVIAGENPAHRIIRNAIDHRKKNNPENLKSFTCETYNKFVFDLLPNKEAYLAQSEKKPDKNKLQETRDSNFQKMIASSEQFHLLVWETITEKQFLYPTHHNEKVLYNRLSGLERPEFVTLAQDLQPFSFYGDYLQLLDKAFLNPITPGSTKKYFFDIQDTLYQGQDSIFIISFQPRKGKKFEALKGVLYIHTNQWAIQNVIAEPAEKTMMDMVFEQKYVWIEDGQQWFPEQLNFEVMMPKYPHKFIGMRVAGKTYVKSPNINPTLHKKDFNNLVYTLGDDVYNKSDSVWQDYQVEPLQNKEIKTYERLDSIGKKINLDKKLDILTAIATGKYPLGQFDLDLSKLLRSNNYEGTRLGLGFATNKQLSKHFTASVYGGYGFRDSTWKYGGALEFHLVKEPQIDLQFSYKKDLREPGISEFPDLSSSLVNRRFYADRMDDIEAFGVSLKTPIFKYAQLKLSLSKENFQPKYDYIFQPNNQEPSSEFDFTTFGVSLRYSYGEQFIPLLGSRVPSGKNPHPIFQLSYERGIENWLGGDYNFDKVLFGVEHIFRLKGIGETSFRLEAGWVNKVLPYSKLFAGSGTGGGFELFAVDYTFQTMRLYEFVSDRYINLFLDHNFGAFLYHAKYSRPEISIVQNIGYGNNSFDPSIHKGIEFQNLIRGFFESGLVVDNLLRIPYFNFAYIGLGMGVYYRYGEYALPQLKDNFAYRLTIDFTL